MSTLRHSRPACVARALYRAPLPDRAGRNAPVWALLDYTLARSGARPLLIEWDADVPEWPALAAEATRARHHLAQAPA